jgi:hypothetical protein
VLDYESGSDEANRTYFRIVANNAGGIFSPEWLPWTDIFSMCHLKDPLTSIQLRALFRGKSVNTAGFLMAVLKDALLAPRAHNWRIESLAFLTRRHSRPGQIL